MSNPNQASRFLIIHPEKAKSSIKVACKNASTHFPASATREILDEFWPMFCRIGSEKFNNRALSDLSTFLTVRVYPEEIPNTVGLWFDQLMEMWMTLDVPSSWEKGQGQAFYDF